MFDEASDVQLVIRLLNVHYLKLTVMHGVEHTVSLFFNDVSKITIINQIISAHIIFLVMVYITSLIPYLNLNLESFTI